MSLFRRKSYRNSQDKKPVDWNGIPNTSYPEIPFNSIPMDKIKWQNPLQIGNAQVFFPKGSGTAITNTTIGFFGANRYLSNLLPTAINESLVPGADNTIDIGSGTYYYKDSYHKGISYYYDDSYIYFGVGGLTGDLGCDSMLYSDGTNTLWNIESPTGVDAEYTNPLVKISYWDAVHTKVFYIPSFTHSNTPNENDIQGIHIGRDLYVADPDAAHDATIFIQSYDYSDLEDKDIQFKLTYDTDNAYARIRVSNPGNTVIGNLRCDLNFELAETGASPAYYALFYVPDLSADITYTFPAVSSTVATTTTALLLDQTSPQTVANGRPIFSSGIDISDNATLEFGVGGLTGALGCDSKIYSDGTDTIWQIESPTGTAYNPTFKFTYIPLGAEFYPHLTGNTPGATDEERIFLGRLVALWDELGVGDPTLALLKSTYDSSSDFARTELSIGGLNTYAAAGTADYMAFNGGIKLENSGFYAIFSTASIATSDKTFTIPNTSGTLALTSDLSSYVPYSGASAALDMGAWYIKAGYYQFPNASYTLQLQANLSYTDNRNWALPNASGTIALQEWVAAGYQPLAGGLTDIAALARTDSNIIVGDGTNWVAESGATARTSLGLAIGTNVQAWSARLDTIAGLTPGASFFIIGNGTSTDWITSTLDNTKTVLGLNTTDSPQFLSIYIGSVNLGHVTDTTLTRVSAGKVAIEGVAILAANLTYASASFIKVTAQDTYAIRTIAETKQDLSLDSVENTALSTWAGTTNLTTAKQVIADNSILTVDQADAADNDYAKFTANGLEGRSYSEVKTDLSLGNVDNTSDANKPVSTAQQAALDDLEVFAYYLH